MNKTEFIAFCNSTRKQNKNQWYALREIVDGHNVAIKGFNTWLQIIEVDGLKSSGTMDCSVKRFNEDIETALYW